MRPDLIVPGPDEEKFAIQTGTQVVTVPFSPLIERVAIERPDMLGGLERLKISMGEADFNKYINSLQSLKRNSSTVMLITDKPMYKTNLEAKFLKQIEEAFEVDFVRIVCM